MKPILRPMDIEVLLTPQELGGLFANANDSEQAIALCHIAHQFRTGFGHPPAYPEYPSFDGLMQMEHLTNAIKKDGGEDDLKDVQWFLSELLDRVHARQKEVADAEARTEAG